MEKTSSYPSNLAEKEWKYIKIVKYSHKAVKIF